MYYLNWLLHCHDENNFLAIKRMIGSWKKPRMWLKVQMILHLQFWDWQKRNLWKRGWRKQLIKQRTTTFDVVAHSIVKENNCNDAKLINNNVFDIVLGGATQDTIGFQHDTFRTNNECCWWWIWDCKSKIWSW